MYYSVTVSYIESLHSMYYNIANREHLRVAVFLSDVINNNLMLEHYLRSLFIDS